MVLAFRILLWLLWVIIVLVLLIVVWLTLHRLFGINRSRCRYSCSYSNTMMVILIKIQRPSNLLCSSRPTT